MNNTERFSNFELFRIVLMFLIVFHHGIVFGLGLGHFSPSLNEDLMINNNDIPIYAILNAFCIVGVNCFVLLSGYFSIKPSVKKVKSLVFQVLFYTILFSSSYQLLKGNYANFFSSLRILSHSGYWFFVDYLILMILAPVLNLPFLYLGRKENKTIMCLLLLVTIYLGFFYNHPVNTNGYTVFQFINLYYIGRYLKTYDISMSIQKCLIIYSISSILSGVVMSYYIEHDNFEFGWHVMHYNSPLVIAASVSLLLLFKNFIFKNNFINKIAVSSFSIYLIQNSTSVSSLYYGAIKKYVNMGFSSILLTILLLLLLTFIIILLSIFVDQARLWIYNKMIDSPKIMRS